MKKLAHFVLLNLVVLFTSNASALVDIDAAIVELRKDCSVAGQLLDNCFNNSIDLTTWIENTRAPAANASSPLQINIGPGTFEYFDLTFPECHITINGSGRQQTIITNKNPVTPTAFMFSEHCVLSVSDLTITNGFQWAIQVMSGSGTPGETTWTDVDVFGNDYGWQDSGNCNAKHSWFNSRIITKPLGFAAIFSRAYTTCAEDWFYSSEISVIADDSSTVPFDMSAIRASKEAEVHVYGSIIRAITEQGVTTQAADIRQSSGQQVVNFVEGVIAVSAVDSANVHIHGSAIDVLSKEGNAVAVIGTIGSAHVHANETSYNLKTGNGGSMTRIMNNGGVVRAPAIWESRETLPNVISVTGQDTGIYTGSVNGRPHHIAYDSTCENKWFDMTINDCI